MTAQTTNRRAFLKAGALIAPLAAAPAAAAIVADRGQGRLADEAGIAAAHRAWLRSDGQGLRLEAHEEPVIAFGEDGVSAIGRYACIVTRETLLQPDSTFAQMALLQGGGRAVTAERRTLVAHYERAADGWRVSGTELLPT